MIIRLFQFGNANNYAEGQILHLDFGEGFGLIPLLIDEVHTSPNSDFYITGSPLRERGSFNLTYDAATFTGGIWLYDREITFSVFPIGKGVHAFIEVDQTMPDHPEDHKHDHGEHHDHPHDHKHDHSHKRDGNTQTPPVSVSSTAPVIDILCVYTKLARNAAQNIQSICSNSGNSLNSLLSNTLTSTSVTVNIVHTMEVDYAEGSVFDDLNSIVHDSSVNWAAMPL